MKPIDRKWLGPVSGNPPTLEWLSLDQLQVDPVYQRAMDGAKSRAIVIGMVKRWNWALCQPLVVTRRECGGLWVIDGQHRLEGARQRGDIPHLPCVVLSARSIEAEADAFVQLNTVRQRLTQTEVFAGMLAQGDPEARRVDAILRETGWRLARHSNTMHYKPGELACAPMLARAIKAHGEPPVRNALAALFEAFSQVPVRQGSTLLRALILLFVEGRVPDPDALIEVLGQCDDPADWLLEAETVRRANLAFSKREALAHALEMAARDCVADALEAA